MACVEIERQISFFSFGFARVTEVRHMYVKKSKKWIKMRVSVVEKTQIVLTCFYVCSSDFTSCTKVDSDEFTL